MNKIEQAWTRTGAAATAVLMTMAPGHASAAGLGDVFDKIRENIASLPNIIAYVAYIAGAGFGISGIMALRQHVDNPAQAPLKNALVRLAAAGALVAFPWLLSTMIGTLGDGSGNVSIPTINTSTK